MERLTEMEVECMEVLRVFKLYAPALAGMGHFEDVHKVGVQGLAVSAIRHAAEVFERYREVYLEHLTAEEPEKLAEPARAAAQSSEAVGQES